MAGEDITFGHVLADECDRLGIDIEAYLDAYDVTAAQPFPGVDEMLAGLDGWAACSNKVGRLARAELERLGWTPEVAFFAEDFTGPEAARARCSTRSACPPTRSCSSATPPTTAAAPRRSARRFALAGWNPRARAEAGDHVLARPADLLDLVDRAASD